MPRTETIAVALLRTYAADDRAPATYILTRRPPGVHLEGKWELPGGKVEPGETPSEALRRELREELGVEIGAAQPLVFSHHDYGTKRVLLLFFGAQILPNSPPPEPLAATELAAVTLAELLHWEMPAANEPLKAHLHLRLAAADEAPEPSQHPLRPEKKV